ncbi:acetamidase [Aeromicrobium sp. PE09-221]|uniref:acetamidase/formamidase family protein n=1 Tax=Aeromicrobium sp. PE09-221 TaxID=1898043 RepID=UPI000B3E8239|nr:acetamidase/formamidase family protein [Aeromicrobium sp. PE09-221]OUZ11938.1 acetamidase [Aeromicrobium sp. PE09-221]
MMLRSGEGPCPGQEYLPARPQELFWGRLPCAADTPVLSVRAGTSVTVDTVSHEGILEDQGSDPVAFFGRSGVAPDAVLPEARDLASGRFVRRGVQDGPHVVTGPVEVLGAQPGDLLAITVLSTHRRVPYGIVSNRHGRGALPGQLPRAPGTFSVYAEVEQSPGDDGSAPAFARMLRRSGGSEHVRIPLRPFLGIMGVAVPGGERPHSVPPGAHGGNIDINLLTVGSTLYLPVRVPGALAYVGDPHFAQGDGEVALTAMEASLRATLRFDVLAAGEATERFGEVAGPLGETVDFLIPTGLDEDLDVAVQNCVRSALGLLQVAYGMDEAHAYAYLSAATDFDISQVVDLVKGVHARIRKADFR